MINTIFTRPDLSQVQWIDKVSRNGIKIEFIPQVGHQDSFLRELPFFLFADPLYF